MKTQHTPGEWKSGFTSSLKRMVRAEGGIICILSQTTRFPGQDQRYEDDLKESEANANLIAISPKMLRFITEIQQALTDKSKHGTKLSVLEHSMLNQANEILNKVK